MRHTNYELNLHAESYPELREAIRELAEEHGILGGTLPAHTATSPAAQAEEAPAAQEKAPEVQQREPSAPAESREPNPDGSMTWYHCPEEKAVWKEPEAGRRRGVYKVDEKTAHDLLAKYEEEEAAEEVVEEPAEDPEQHAAEEEAAPAKQSKPKVTLEEVRQAVMAFAKEHGNARGKDLVEGYGVKKISDLPEDKWEEILIRIEGAA